MTGGSRFDRTQAPVPRTPVVHTLYDALVVDRTASPREIRKIARNLRRNVETDTSALHDVCLAEAVLGQPELRAEYDALLARMEAAGIQAPKIGVAIEPERLGPAFTTRLGAAGGATVDGAGKVMRAILPLTFGIGILVAMAKCLGSTGTSRYDKKFEYKPIQLPKYDIPKFDSKAYFEALERLRETRPHFDPKTFDSLADPGKPLVKPLEKTPPKSIEKKTTPKLRPRPPARGAPKLPAPPPTDPPPTP